MANLTWFEKLNFEKLFGMGSGYVLDFSNRTFEEFIADSVGRNIFDDRYAQGSGSKANRLRAFWSKEPNHIVGKLLNSLLDYYRASLPGGDCPRLYLECRRVAERFQDAPVQDIEVFSAISAEKDFEALATAVREAIEKNEPEAGLDRLHTFTVKYIRTLCVRHGIAVERDKALHCLFGEYVKHLKKSGSIETEMTERILKSSISIFDAFNDVRNNRSFAHDNPALNYSESLLIFNHVANVIRFIRALEEPSESRRNTAENSANVVSHDIPF